MDSRLHVVVRPTPQKASLPHPADSMTLGDVLYRLAIVSPNDYRAIETLARDAFQRRWPHDGDQLFLDTTRLSR
jgi:hypothetical protein